MFHVAELTEVMRQKDRAFAEMLNRLRKHRKSDILKIEDVMTLRKCETGEENDALHICATNDEVDSHNLTELKARCSDLVSIEAEDFHKNAKTGKLEKRECQYIRVRNSNLSRKLTVAVGARVMLTKNIDVSDGLVNGVFGSVSHIEQTTNSAFSDVIYVVFDNRKVGGNLRKHTKTIEGIAPNSSPIFRQEDQVTSSGGIRRQFPLKLAFACTIHKIQGSTLNKVNISLEKVFSAGQAYVALSRVTSLDGLVIQNFKEAAIYCSEKVATAMSDMPPFISSNINSETKKHGGLELILQNIQGLMPHLGDIARDIRFTDSDFISLTETWLSKNDQHEGAQLNGFMFYHKSRYECYDDMEDSCADLQQQERGGVGLYHKQNTDCQPLNLAVTNMEYIAFYTADCNIVVVVIYRPPSYRMETFRRHLISLLRKLDDMGKGFLVIGDFNENILKSSSVLKLMNDHGYVQYVKEPTTEGGTLIDHVYVRGVKNVDVRVIPTYFSYHEAISFQFSY